MISRGVSYLLSVMSRYSILCKKLLLYERQKKLIRTLNIMELE